MKSLPDTSHISTLSRIYCEAVGRSEFRISDLASGNPYLFKRLRAGAGCAIATYNRVLCWLSDHWPADLAWPSDIPRPAPSSPASDPKEAA